MLYYALVFFIVAIVAAIFGFGGIAAGAVEIAKILFFIALALNSEFIGLKAQDLNLVTAALVTLALVLPATRKKLFARKNGGA